MAIVLMVKPNSTSTDAAPDLLPEEFLAHEIIVAESIDDAMTASHERAPHLILLPGDQWLYWVAQPKSSRRTRSVAAREFLEMARPSVERAN